MVRLKVYDGQEKLREVELAAEVVTIGREPGNKLVLPDASVSRRHAQVEPNGNFFILRDNGSTNGTFVNEMLVRVHVLNPGDTVRVGKYLLRVDAGRRKDHESTKVRVERLCLPGSRSKGAGDQPTTVVHFENEPPIADSSRARLLRLHQILEEVAPVDEPEALMERVLDALLAELQADRGSVILCERAAGPDASAEPIFTPAAVRCRKSGAEEGAELVIPEELLRAAVAQRQGIQSDTQDGARRPSLVVPLLDKRLVRGVVYVERAPSGGPFDREDLQYLEIIASHAASSLWNARLYAGVSAEKEKLQAVFTSLADGVLVTDSRFVVEEANAAAVILLGLEERNPLGTSLFDLIAGFEVHPEPDVIRASSLREGAVFQLTRDSGGGAGGKVPREVCLAGNIMPYPPASPAPKGLVVTLRDRAEALRLESLKIQFLGNLAHKLRSPLTVLEGSLPLLRSGRGEPAGETAQILEEMERNSRALCHLVNEFTEFAELELRSSRFQSSPVAVKLKAVVREAVRSAEKEASQKGILVVERVREGLPAVLGRPEPLLRAFRHILENAVKFTGHGGHVVVEAEDLGACIRVDIVDDGPGIPREQVEAVFYICHQVDVDGTGQMPGAGLGLTVARHVVQEHGGEIWITSPYRFPDHGTRVSVVLPSKPSRAADGEAAASAARDGDVAAGASAAAAVAGGGVA